VADPRHFAPAVDGTESSSSLERRVLLTQDDFDALVRELDALRHEHRSELARRLREARTFGGSTENDDLLAVAEDAGRESRYLLIGRRGEQSGRFEVTMASPVGKVLRGSHAGDVVTVALPNRRSRTLRVLDVVHGSSAMPDGAARAA
jgi:transcription elongation GreA/GreB family factor